jgi:xylose dehydrogenase (NAD/NADP)
VGSNKLRWGILGCANIAVQYVIPAIQQSAAGKVVAIASRELEKAERAAKRFGIDRAYGSYAELIADDEIDAVYIPLPNHMHYEWTIRAARANKHILCEKPLALNENQAVKMVEACELNGVKLAEAFMYRYHPRYERIKELLNSGEIGSIRLIRGAFTFNTAADKGNVRFIKEWGGGSLYDVGCYPISAARLLLECEPEAVTVHAMLSPEHDNVDMMAAGIVEFAGGIALAFDCGMWADSRNPLEIVGTDGRIEVPAAFIYKGEQANFYVVKGGERHEEKVPAVNQYALQVEELSRSILENRPLRFPAEDAILNMRVIDACLMSANERRRISLD